MTAQAEPGAGLLVQVKYLLLPAFALTLVLFGYIARITRAGMIEAFDSDYARTAYLKGLPSSVVVRRHVLRNALLPTIAVIAVQMRLPGRRPRRRREAVQLPGDRPAHLRRGARHKDLPLLTAACSSSAIVYLVVTLIADILYACLNPRIRFGGRHE